MRNPDWLYHDDIGGLGADPVTLTVRGVEEVECGGRERIGLRFRFRCRGGVHDKLLVLNMVNAEMCQRMWGSVAETWPGRRVRLHTVDTGTEYGPGIRIMEDLE